MKPLLQIRTKPKPKVSSSLDHFTAEQSEFIGRFGREEIREMIAGLKPDQSLHYIARMYNMHDVFTDLMKLTGPAVVKLVSYSITEFPLRILSQFHEKGIIQKLDMVLDFTVSRTPALKQFAKHFAKRVRFIDNHAKILLIENDEWKIVHIGSANFTKNNRFELGLIITDKSQFEEYKLWFEKLFENAVD